LCIFSNELLAAVYRAVPLIVLFHSPLPRTDTAAIFATMAHGGPVARVKLSIEAQQLASMDWTSKSVRA
jgi:hypothetical protein